VAGKANYGFLTDLDLPPQQQLNIVAFFYSARCLIDIALKPHTIDVNNKGTGSTSGIDCWVAN
jgi:hypothetical protein